MNVILNFPPFATEERLLNIIIWWHAIKNNDFKMGEVFPNRMSPVDFASLSHITNLINSIASGSLLQVHFFDVVVRLSFFNLSFFFK